MIRFGSGTYNVHDVETKPVTSKNATTSGGSIVGPSIVATVHFLDDSHHDFEMQRNAFGQELLDRVFAYLELVEKDYFCLQFADLDDDCAMRWLEPTKSVRKQMQCAPYVLFFRVKFYPTDPGKLYEEYTRYHVFLQLRKDIFDGKLYCPDSSLALLASYAAQSQFGDYCAVEHGNHYLDDFQFVAHQSHSFLRKLHELHKLHTGQTPADAEYNFLDHAKRLEMYGVDLYSAKDSNLVDISLGVTAHGITVFQNSIRINTFSWTKILRVSFKRKQFFVTLKQEIQCSEGAEGDANANCETVIVGFNMVSMRQAKRAWKACIEHHTFFRLIAPPSSVPVRPKIFSLGSKYRYSGRTEYQSIEEMKRRAKIERTFNRSGSKLSSRSSLATSHAPTNSSDSRMSPGSAFLTRKRMSHAESPRYVHPTSDSTDVPCSFRHETTFGATTDVIETARSSNSGSGPSTPRNPPAYTHHIRQKPPPLKMVPSPTNSPLTAAPSISNGNGTSHRSPLYSVPRSYEDVPPIPTWQKSETETTTESARSNGLPVSSDLITIRIKSDINGRFGFNVKGGSDQSHPIIVSRVAPNSAADLAYPRLNEGDQVLMINGRDISQLTHDQVVSFIRSARESSVSELVITVRPNVYVGEDEPDFSYVPETFHINDSQFDKADVLDQSLLLLQDTLESGAALTQFEQLYRKKPGLTMLVCRETPNVHKNRYRDICPYDSTRVLLNRSNSCADGTDYINANFVNMPIAGTSNVNRYIAAQGPLPHTTHDFWQMIWEQSCATVVMLTATVERGRVKCHQYWPASVSATDEYGQLVIRLEQESGLRRELLVTNRSTGEERPVTLLQYVAWPDHGVPDDCTQFIDFVREVRMCRSTSQQNEPLLVHCSAGIGRTGVMILMETAMCLIEVNQPIYPLEIVRTMRDQRAMLIQTATQYKFVCDAILRVYREEIVRTLSEYKPVTKSKKCMLPATPPDPTPPATVH